MGFIIKPITRHVVLFKFKTRAEAAKALLRPQEYYESPKFANKIFTLGEYLSWYSEYEAGGATYAKETHGYNIPSWVFEPFIKGLFDPLSPEETEIINAIKYRTDKFYLIGICEDSDSDVETHETAHGLYYTNEKYKKAVDKILTAFNLNTLKAYMKKIGYGQHVIMDECHAFIIASAEWLYDSENIQVQEELIFKLRSCMQKYLAIERKKLKNGKS
jgi:hypothetical protein